MKFDTLEQLKAKFTAGALSPPSQVEVAGVTFVHTASTSYSIQEMVQNNKKGVLLYEAATELPQSTSLNQWMLFVWATNNKHQLTPSSVLSIKPKTNTLEEAQNLTAKPRTLRPGDVIGDTVSVRFASIGSTPIKGKVDTGAEISSLHADNWNIRGNKVEFTCAALSPNTIVLPLLNQQAVKSVSGVQYRPVVELTVKINDKVINNVEFNLADRKHMDYPVLVGQNVLEKGKFLIDPSLREDVDWNYIHEQTKDVLAENMSSSIEDLEQVYGILKNNNVSFADLIRHIRTEVTQTLEDIKY